MDAGDVPQDLFPREIVCGANRFKVKMLGNSASLIHDFQKRSKRSHDTFIIQPRSYLEEAVSILARFKANLGMVYNQSNSIQHPLKMTGTQQRPPNPYAGVNLDRRLAANICCNRDEPNLNRGIGDVALESVLLLPSL